MRTVRIAHNRSDRERVMLFLDTEFTDFHRPQLLSLGLVDDTGQHLFYGRVADIDRAVCSDFVLENVLPKLDARFPACEKAAGGVLRLSAMSTALVEWLEALRAVKGGGQVHVVCDYWADGDLFLEVLGTHCPAWVEVEDIGPKMPPIETGDSEHGLRHHALFDALQLRHAYAKASAAGAFGWV